MKKDYYIGIDIGVGSVGVACCDENYNILKFNDKDCLVSRIFEKAETNQTRRMKRCARRLIERRRKRIYLLKEIFKDEIDKKDPYFFKRLENSRYHNEDKGKINKQDSNIEELKLNEQIGKYSLFNDPNFTDKDYHLNFPTIYHLRQALIDEKNEKHNLAISDIRLVYLAVEHIIKKRGSFVFEGMGTKLDGTKFTDCLANLNDKIGKIRSFFCEKEILAEEPENFNWREDIKENDIKYIKKPSCLKERIIKIIATGNVSKSDIKQDVFGFEEYEGEKINLLKENWDEKIEIDELKDVLNEFAIIAQSYNRYKRLGNSAVSEYFINVHKNNHENLLKLKKILREIDDKNGDHKCYEIFFHTSGNVINEKDTKCLYNKLVGKDKEKSNINKKGDGKNTILELFENKLKELFWKKSDSDDTNFSEGEYTELFKQDFNCYYDSEFIKSNGHLIQPLSICNSELNLPFQYHYDEIEKILKNVAKKYSFLNEVNNDETNVCRFTNCNKILKLMEFRMPYWCGITKVDGSKKLNDVERDRRTSWMVKKEKYKDVKIRPWNFDEVVDTSKTASDFIKRMLNYCTYCYGEEVLPKEDLIYQEYCCLNQLNKLKFFNSENSKEEYIDSSIKQTLWNDLYLKGEKISKKILAAKLRESYGCNIKSKDVKIGNGSEEEKDISSMTSVAKLKMFFNNDPKKVWENKEVCNELIKLKTILPEGNIINDAIQDSPSLKEFFSVSDGDDKKIKSLSFKGWGRISKKCLDELLITKKDSGEAKTVLNWMKNTSYNFMEIIGNKEVFDTKTLTDHNKNYLDKNNTQTVKTPSEYLKVSKAPVPAWVFRSFNQAIKVVDEYIECLGSKPKKIFIETTRFNGESTQTVSRTKQIENHLKKLDTKDKNNKEHNTSLKDNFNNHKSDLNDDKYFLYFLQHGKDLYTGKTIDINNINDYEVDHIIPRSLIKNDSIENKVLTSKQFNKDVKKDVYPFGNKISTDARKILDSFEKNKIISNTKYENIICNDECKKDKIINDFINRDLVQTGWEVELLRKYFEWNKEQYGNEVKIIPNKPVNAKRLRKIFNIVKCRDLDDSHHAVDAYLNIVSGDILCGYENFLRYEDFFNSLKIIFENDKKEKAYAYDDFYSCILKSQLKKKMTEKISDVVEKLNVNITTKLSYEPSNGGFWNETKQTKNDVKKSDTLSFNLQHKLDAKKYGGYSSVSSYFYTVIKTKTNVVKMIAIHAVLTRNISIDMKNFKKCKEDIKQVIVNNKNIYKLDSSDFEILYPFIPQGSILEFGTANNKNKIVIGGNAAGDNFYYAFVNTTGIIQNKKILVQILNDSDKIISNKGKYYKIIKNENNTTKELNPNLSLNLSEIYKLEDELWNFISNKEMGGIKSLTKLFTGNVDDDKMNRDNLLRSTIEYVEWTKYQQDNNKKLKSDKKYQESWDNENWKWYSNITLVLEMWNKLVKGSSNGNLGKISIEGKKVNWWRTKSKTLNEKVSILLPSTTMLKNKKYLVNK